MDAIKLMDAKFSLLLIRRSLVQVQQGEPEIDILRQKDVDFYFFTKKRIWDFGK